MSKPRSPHLCLFELVNRVHCKELGANKVASNQRACCRKDKNTSVGASKLEERSDSQREALVPGGVEAASDGLGLLLALTLWIWDELELDVGVRQAVGVHGNQVPGLFDCDNKKKASEIYGVRSVSIIANATLKHKDSQMRSEQFTNIFDLRLKKKKRAQMRRHRNANEFIRV